MKVNEKKFDCIMGNAVCSIKELSKKTGIAEATIVRIKSGNQEGRPTTLGKIAKALDVKIEDFID